MLNGFLVSASQVAISDKENSLLPVQEILRNSASRPRVGPTLFNSGVTAKENKVKKVKSLSRVLLLGL